MSVGERDPFTGHQTTGHEWNGIKELNTPVPRPVYFFLITMGVFALGWTLLMPSWPYGTGYFKGLLGVDQKQAVARSIKEATAERANWMTRIEKEDLAQIQSDTDLMRTVREDGRTLFGDNCAACHGANARGNKGFPNIADSPMLWGDDPQTVLQTVTAGINGADPNTRVSQMLAFGRDGMLTQEQVSLLAGFVTSLSDPAMVTDKNKEDIAKGKDLFVTNCVACHGKDAKGLVESGAPNLTDQYWIYGGNRGDIYQTIFSGRQGHMPSWGARLTPAQIKIITLYLLDLRKKRAETTTGGAT
ncbi:cytochrome-c oxidase, cbb3-type subunit III [Phyllobacterium endophyticum]|uniref:Cbb3-type cytochrome c oxidase subunit n=1 Tax=Phyllobacterium endophyticum TaxID=1149773 RepID=A0A2P7ASD5_9HYPH|nr:cytochrome-c oxidase, cbb3-type subunit III [Phyllobacterium endophyticum]MBB3236873.1 cytochrome c oxidase cbb3-type subunit 3 [Phyllobacterium endophyticum]PSH57126.1 cytochrome-c oxidase, cbb3-type subunit III [Phyllobacterium endophyticum]TYR40407.1 cytochrome-c oxidase, cbb3-type subunit III [Phyllobacterium endophyticum]